ncbi:MAG: precorrin-3B C(17)-methyltransferase [Synechococcaceae cyanobacterium]|nr:precorrin-3B C(17)-methyltransferase [Synechococcaceae cyanobacterium]
MSEHRRRIVALGFSPASRALLERLQAWEELQCIRWPDDPTPAAQWLEREWLQAGAVLAVGACGLVTRLIAPLLTNKLADPAVIVLDPRGRHIVPLLGGHAAGAEALSLELAALLGGEAVLTGATADRGGLALDSYGQAWGWQRGSGDWSALMQRAARGELPRVQQEAGLNLWQQLPAAAEFLLPQGAGPEPSLTDLVISPRTGPGCRWHPPCLWLGLGCERGTDLSLLERLLERGLAEAGMSAAAVAGLASIDRKGDEAALLALACQRQWPLRLFPAAALAEVKVPHPSARVMAEMGTGSVAEAAAWLAARTPASATGASDGASGASPSYALTKTVERAQQGERGAATLAIVQADSQWAPRRGELHLVGSGPGDLALLSADARRALARCSTWVGYSLYLDLLEPLRRPDQLRREGRLTAERDRCAEALALASQGLRVALISSGDSGIYGMAGLALELWLQQPAEARPCFSVHPGLSALQLAAARVGAPLMHDFCTISLSDRLTPWPVIERRLRAAADGDFVVALYNPRSRDRSWQLERARQLLLEGRPGTTPVVLARQLGRPEEAVGLHELGSLPVDAVDMLTLVLIGNSSSYVRDGRMVTPRGYPGAALA